MEALMVNCWFGVSLPLSATAQSNAQTHYLKGSIQLSFLYLVCFHTPFLKCSENHHFLQRNTVYLPPAAQSLISHQVLTQKKAPIIYLLPFSAKHNHCFLLNMQSNLHLMDRFWAFQLYQSQTHISVCSRLLFCSEVNLNFRSKPHNISEQNYNIVWNYPEALPRLCSGTEQAFEGTGAFSIAACWAGAIAEDYMN